MLVSQFNFINNNYLLLDNRYSIVVSLYCYSGNNSLAPSTVGYQ
jgi:hypothetical protein